MKYDPEVNTIIYATDLGPQTRPVFRHAMALAKMYGAKVVMLHVVEPMTDTALAVINSYLSKEFADGVQRDTLKEMLGKMKQRLNDFYEDECDESEKQASLVKELLVLSGKPSEEILRLSEEENAGMIVMGKSTRKVRGVRVMGSTARRVSRMAHIPVLVVPNYD